MKKLFGDIIGQRGVVRLLSAQLETDNLSHAYLFLGPQGTGKEHLAKEFAKYVLCDELGKEDCPNCTKFDRGVHPDFIVIDGSEGIKIENVREATERLNLSPNLSKKKVIFFKKAENMGIEAANALLKTLEEPPLDSVIILTAISEKSLPQTIVSRVQKIKLNSLSAKDIKDILEKEFPAAEIEKVVAYSEGSIGETKKLLTDKEHLTEKVKIYEDIKRLFDSDSVIEKFKILEEYEKKKTLKSFFNIFAKLIFDSIEKDLSQNEPVNQAFKNLTLEQRIKIGEKILKIYADLDYNVNLRLILEAIILENLGVTKEDRNA